MVGKTQLGASQMNLAGFSSARNIDPVDGFIEAVKAKKHQGFVCGNRYDFLDKLLHFLEENEHSSIICSDPKIQSYLDSCGQQYVDENTISAHTAEVLCTADLAIAEKGMMVFDIKNESLSRQPNIFIIHQDHILGSIKAFFSRIKYQDSQGESKSVHLVKAGKREETQPQQAYFVLKFKQ